MRPRDLAAQKVAEAKTRGEPLLVPTACPGCGHLFFPPGEIANAENHTHHIISVDEVACDVCKGFCPIQVAAMAG